MNSLIISVLQKLWSPTRLMTTFSGCPSFPRRPYHKRKDPGGTCGRRVVKSATIHTQSRGKRLPLMRRSFFHEEIEISSMAAKHLFAVVLGCLIAWSSAGISFTCTVCVLFEFLPACMCLVFFCGLPARNFLCCLSKHIMIRFYPCNRWLLKNLDGDLLH
jgi:hypothetical protein